MEYRTEKEIIEKLKELEARLDGINSSGIPDDMYDKLRTLAKTNQIIGMARAIAWVTKKDYEL